MIARFMSFYKPGVTFGQKHRRASALAQERVSAVSATSTSDEGRSPRRCQERGGEDAGCWFHQAYMIKFISLGQNKGPKDVGKGRHE